MILLPLQTLSCMKRNSTNKLRIWKEAAVTISRYYSNTLLTILGKTMETLVMITSSLIEI